MRLRLDDDLAQATADAWRECTPVSAVDRADKPRAGEGAAAQPIVAKVDRAGKAAKRELIDTGTNKIYVGRNTRGASFKEVEDVRRSLSQDRRRKAKTVAKRGQGDRGDRR